MIDRRRVQRALFRMQLSPGFSCQLREGHPEATQGLREEELRLLRGTCESAVRADRGDRRHHQFLGNVSSEFRLTCAGTSRRAMFIGSPECDAAVRDDTSLPLAFGRFATRIVRNQERGDRALVALECALALARRELRSVTIPGSGLVVLSASVWLVTLPAGTLALAAATREAGEEGASRPAPDVHPTSNETVLIRSSPPARPLGLREVEAEYASPALAALLHAALEPVTRRWLALTTETPRAELDPVIDELVADGVLVAG